MSLARAQQQIGSTERIPFRVRIGGVGHRDPVDFDQLRSDVLETVRTIPQCLNAHDSTAVRFTLVTALADGSDQLIASTLFDELGDDLLLHAVVPTTVDAYERELDDKAQFRALLERADQVTELEFSGTSASAYAAAGRFIVRHTDLIVALWDGRDARGRGGTGETVRYAHRRGSEVLVVAAGRESEPELPPLRPPPATFASPAAKRLIVDYRHIDLYSRAAGSNAARRERAVLHEHLEPRGRGSSLEQPFGELRAWAEPGLAQASALADRYQRRFTVAGALVFILAALAAIAVAAQALLHAARGVVWIEVALLAVLLGVYFWARYSRLLDRWLGYRSLAEGFRSAMLIAMAAGVARGGSGDEHHLTDAGTDVVRGSQPFQQRAFSEAWRTRPRVKLQAADASALGGLVSGWLKEQIDYHREVRRRDDERQSRLDISIGLLFVAAFIVAVAHGTGIGHSDVSEEVLPLLAIALPTVGGAIAGIRDQRSYRLHAARSARTADGLEEIAAWLDGETSLPRITRLMLDAQSVIDAERQDWSSVFEFRYLELVL
jgi:hypothetical protein